MSIRLDLVEYFDPVSTSPPIIVIILGDTIYSAIFAKVRLISAHIDVLGGIQHLLACTFLRKSIVTSCVFLTVDHRLKTINA